MRLSPAPRRLTDQRNEAGERVPRYATGTVRQPDYSPAEHDRWSRLLARQRAALPGRAAQAYLHAWERCGPLWQSGIPSLASMAALLGSTGFSVVAVEGLLDGPEFFNHLAQRRFPITWWLREEAELDYIVEPDVFHDVVGHVPLLLLPAVAGFMQRVGQAGEQLKTQAPALIALGRLYWFTVEFGLIQETGGVRAWGAGILSSPQETVWALGASPVHRRLRPSRALRQSYRIDEPQPRYFVLNRWEVLNHWTTAEMVRWAQRAAQAPSLG